MNETSQAGNFWLLLQLIVVFLAVAALALYTMRFLARRLPGVGRGRHLRIVEQVYVAPNRSICLVAVPGRVLVVGVAERAMSVLAVLDEPELMEALQAPVAGTAPAGVPTGNFAARLRQLLDADVTPRGQQQATWPEAIRSRLDRLRRARAEEDEDE